MVSFRHGFTGIATQKLGACMTVEIGSISGSEFPVPMWPVTEAFALHVTTYSHALILRKHSSDLS